MLAKVYAAACIGLDGELVEIECDLTNSLPGFVVVGLAARAVDEARERVRSALKNSGLTLPPKRITFNLAPADLPKEGTGYDLAMAVALLIASRQLESQTTAGALFLGELALDGSLRPIKGALLAAQVAQRQGFTHIYVPAENAAEAALLRQGTVIGVRDLRELYYHLAGGQQLKVVKNTSNRPLPSITQAPDLGDICGQAQAKRALEIAAAGGHNLLFTGRPGSGKTLMARALIGLLPPPTFSEMLEITKLHSLAGLNSSSSGVIANRPFRTPHHSASSSALIGGGLLPRPGEISLSHHGVLLLDELPEFPRSVLEMLRQPLEDGQVTVSRALRATTFPARFMLVGTRNPCPCGFAGDSRCTCTAHEINHYQRRLSGPLLDRIDLQLEVVPVSPDELMPASRAEASSVVAVRVLAARRRQAERYRDELFQLNAQLGPAGIIHFCRLDEASQRLAAQATRQFRLSTRAYHRVLKVARTIADLAGETSIRLSHLSEALQYRAHS